MNLTRNFHDRWKGYDPALSPFSSLVLFKRERHKREIGLTKVSDSGGFQPPPSCRPPHGVVGEPSPTEAPRDPGTSPCDPDPLNGTDSTSGPGRVDSAELGLTGSRSRGPPPSTPEWSTSEWTSQVVGSFTDGCRNRRSGGLCSSSVGLDRETSVLRSSSERDNPDGVTSTDFRIPNQR